MINEKQANMMNHAIGLQGRTRKPYRNYYNSGEYPYAEWDDLVTKGLAILKVRSKQMGGHYYHLTDKGFEFVLKNPDTFDMDRRVKRVKTLKSWCHD